MPTSQPKTRLCLSAFVFVFVSHAAPYTQTYLPYKHIQIPIQSYLDRPTSLHPTTTRGGHMTQITPRQAGRDHDRNQHTRRAETSGGSTLTLTTNACSYALM